MLSHLSILFQDQFKFHVPDEHITGPFSTKNESPTLWLDDGIPLILNIAGLSSSGTFVHYLETSSCSWAGTSHLHSNQSINIHHSEALTAITSKKEKKSHTKHLHSEVSMKFDM